MKPITLEKNVETLLRSSFGPEPVQAGNKINFGSALKSAISQVDSLHKDADKHVAGLVTGNEKDIHQTMIALEKASVSFKLVMQVRNKIVEAYKQIERMAV